MSLDISLVPNGILTQTLAGLWKYLLIAVEWTAGRAGFDDIVRAFLTGQYALWVVYDTKDNALKGFFATEFKQYPQKKVLCIQHCVIEPGNMKEIESRMQELATRFAKDNGCNGIEFVGRPGWRGYSKRHGYKPQSVVYHKFFDEVTL